MFKITPEEADFIVEKRESIAEGWGTLPKGWTMNSLKKFWDSLTGDRKHKITKCMKKMGGKVSDPGAFCASLARKIGYTPGSVDMTFKITAKERDLLLARREATGKKAKKGDPAVEGLKKSIMKQKAKIKKAREAYKAKMAPMKAELGKMREQLKKTREKAKKK